MKENRLNLFRYGMPEKPTYEDSLVEYQRVNEEWNKDYLRAAAAGEDYDLEETLAPVNSEETAKIETPAIHVNHELKIVFVAPNRQLTRIAI